MKVFAALLVICQVLLVVDAFSPVSSSTSRVRCHPHVFSPSVTTNPPLLCRYDYSLKSSDNGNGSSAATTTEEKSKFKIFYRLPKTAYRIYKNYAKRLWSETSVDARTRLANEKVKGAIRNTQHILRSNEYADFTEASSQARERLLESCDALLDSMPPAAGKGGSSAMTAAPVNGEQQQTQKAATTDNAAVELQEGPSKGATKKKPRRSILFGVFMGAAVACWVFSGNYLFTGIFCLMTILGQLEYYRMVMNTGVYPARRISIIGACAMFLTALFAPDLHQTVLPTFGLWSMIWFLTMRRQVTTIPEIATTFTGMFMLGYVPSFWVRTRLIGGNLEPTRLAPIAGPFLEWLSERVGTRIPVPDALIHLPITTGAVFIFWTWLCLAFSDVGAYFVGRKYGLTKLGEISPAAGATSPNKSLEGVFGGCLVSGALGILGAWVQKWPYFVLTGAIHGCMLALLGLIGDLTASMLKRDAGLKDFGDLLPEHGGILDRVDSFIWTAPYSWIVCQYIIPGLQALSMR